MAEEAPKRSIDEIIGSIRSIMDRGGNVANDDVPVDLTDLPTGGGFAEPMAPRIVGDAFGDDIAEPMDAADAERMAQIAETVNRNLDAAPTPVETTTYPPDPDPAPADAPAPELSEDAIVASFGRRGSASRPAPRAAGAIGPAPRAMHDRFVAIGEVVEEAVTARGVVRAANDAAPAPIGVDAATSDHAPSTAIAVPEPVVAVPAPMAAPPVQNQTAQPGPATDPLLDDATLRPIIREWLDDNLPPLVERLVREELQKAIHGGRRGR